MRGAYNRASTVCYIPVHTTHHTRELQVVGPRVLTAIRLHFAKMIVLIQQLQLLAGHSSDVPGHLVSSQLNGAVGRRRVYHDNILIFGMDGGLGWNAELVLEGLVRSEGELEVQYGAQNEQYETS